MPNFDPIFSKTSARPIKYLDKTLFRAHHISFADGDKFLVTLEKTSGGILQGISLYAFATFEVIGQRLDNGIVLWENTAPKNILIIISSNCSGKKPSKWLPSKGLLGVKNVWDKGTGVVESWYNGAAMIVEEIKNGWRYHCNDGRPDENFDDLVFTIKKFVPNEM